MYCPVCGMTDTSVVDSRVVSEGAQVRRRRECNDCRLRFTTYEVADMTMPRIIKRDGRRVAFDLEKLRYGLSRALEKRPVTAVDFDATLARLLQRLRAYPDQEVDSQKMGEWVMDELKELDQVAYVRFASVYRSFQDIDAFHDEIMRLRKAVQETE
jgi:transcriptional repressor NrdR